MGIVVCLVMFKQRGCEWTPGNRVLSQINTSQILITDSVRCVLRENGIEEDEIFKLLQNGDVVFGESRTRDTPKYYVIANNKNTFKVGFSVRSDTVSVVDGVPGGKKTSCTGGNVEHILNMPEKTVKRILKAKEITAADSILVKLRTLKINDGELYNMIGAGKIDFTQSMPTLKPHPVYFVDYKSYRFTIEMADEKTRILDVVSK